MIVINGLCGCSPTGDSLVDISCFISDIKCAVNNGATVCYDADMIDNSFARVNERNASNNLSDEQFANFRKVIETPSSQNAVFRSSSPFNCTSRGICADNCAKQANVKTIICLNENDEDIAKSGGYCSKQSVYRFTIERPFDVESNKESINKIISLLSTCDGPILICDSEGLYGTGFIAALLQYYCGYSEDYASVDWAISYMNLSNTKISQDDYNSVMAQLKEARTNLCQCVNSEAFSMALCACRANLCSVFDIEQRQMKYLNMKRLTENYFHKVGIDQNTLNLLDKKWIRA